MIKKLLFVKAIFLCIIVGMMTAAPRVMADTVTVYQVNGYYSGNGGEFTLKIKNNNLSPDLNSLWGLYSSNTRDIGTHDPSFQSFCLETHEYVSIGSTYHVTISDRAINGGVGPQGDPVSKGTAWLYHQFQSTGGLPGYNYTEGDGRENSAGALQATIWWLEDEASDPGSGNAFRNLVLSQFGDFAHAHADNYGLYPVAVLNLTDSDRCLHQDQLVCVPPTEAPEPATLLLMGSGLIGLAGLARRKFKK
jgi:hypothetical protein